MYNLDSEVVGNFHLNLNVNQDVWHGLEGSYKEIVKFIQWYIREFHNATDRVIEGMEFLKIAMPLKPIGNPKNNSIEIKYDYNHGLRISRDYDIYNINMLMISGEFLNNPKYDDVFIMEKTITPCIRIKYFEIYDVNGVDKRNIIDFRLIINLKKFLQTQSICKKNIKDFLKGK
jgi:predicted nucleic-acid-binding Zn-ribbon protein